LKIIRLEVVQPLVIRDYDLVPGVQTVAPVRHFHTELFTLSHGLKRNRKRGKNQHAATGFTRPVFGYGQLNSGLAESAICEHRAPPLSASPLHKRPLKRE
jgi:hypothetical protein